MSRRQAARCWRLPTTATLATAGCFHYVESFTGKPIDREYAETRALRERIYEATPNKGRRRNPPISLSE